MRRRGIKKRNLATAPSADKGPRRGFEKNSPGAPRALAREALQRDGEPLFQEKMGTPPPMKV